MTRLSAFALLTLLLAGWARAQTVISTQTVNATSQDGKTVCTFTLQTRPQISINCTNTAASAVQVVTPPSNGNFQVGTALITWVLAAPVSGSVPFQITSGTVGGGTPAQLTGTF